jgi:outer membrane protein insertion porin family
MSRGGLLGLGAAVLALAAGACRSAPPLGGGKVKVNVEFAGEFELQRDELEAAIAPDLENLERRNTPRSAVDDASYALVELLRERGYPQARVEYEVLESTERELHARFTLDQGPRTRVVRLDFVGATRYSRGELAAAIGVRDPKPNSASPLWFVERDYERAVGALEAYYVDHGFAQVRVEPPLIEISADGERAEVTLAVVEGPRFFVLKPPTIAGGIAELEAQLDWTALVKRPFTPRSLQQARGAIGELYESSGYPDARVEPAEVELRESGEARLSLNVTPGPLVTIGGVRVEGAERTRAGFARAFVRFERGQKYSVTVLRESFRRLFATGLFTRVQMRLEPDGAEVRDLVVELEEAPSREIYVEPGLGSYEGPRMLVGWRDINLFGSGRVLRIEGLAAELAQRALVSVTEPRLFGTDFQGSLSLFREVRDEPSYDKDERGLGVSVLRNLSRQARAELEYRYRRSELTAVDILDPLAQDELDDFDISSVALSLGWDSRDSVFTPTRGVQARISAEIADESLGSELGFLRTRLIHATFVPLSDAATLGLSYRAGVITPLGSTDTIPVQERFFNGGENTVRSFREDQLGPKDSTGEPLGGEVFHTVSVELRHDLRGALGGALFYDGGNVESSARDALHFDGFRHAVGVGLRYALPIGPLRFDIAANPDRRDGESDWVTHFSVGMSF